VGGGGAEGAGVRLEDGADEVIMYELPL
jgi:hypothetical protein